VREESHLDDMRTAIRGDFERLAERRGGQELMREPEVPPEHEPQLEAEREPAPPELAPLPAPTPGVEPVPVAEAEATEAAPPPEEIQAGEPRTRSFLDRLLGR